jgi:magnesium-transporting ATPase (P-type)
MAFATLSLSELALVFAIRAPHAQAWQLARNPWLFWSVIGSATLVGAVVYLPWAHAPFSTHSLGGYEAIVCATLAVAPLLVVEVGKALVARGSRAATAGNQPTATSERPVVGARP